MSIMHKNIELCENIDKLGMFLRSSDENTEKKINRLAIYQKYWARTATKNC